MKPEILTHPHIPKPLHGLNPRTILGQVWWDRERFGAQARTNYTCVACGVHKSNAEKYKWLEGHEYWDINYITGICEVKSIEPLCHYCHNFIHSGRLIILLDKEKITKQEVINILEHGFKILADNNLKCFPFTAKLAESFKCNIYGVKSYSLPTIKLDWNRYKMLLNGEIYESKFKNYDEWKKFYEG